MLMKQYWRMDFWRTIGLRYVYRCAHLTSQDYVIGCEFGDLVLGCAVSGNYIR